MQKLALFTISLVVATFACKPKDGPDFQLQDAVADNASFNTIKLQMKGDAKTGVIEGSFKYEGDTLSPGTKVTLVYDVVSNGSKTVLCSVLKKRAEVTLKGKGETGSFKFQIDPKDFLSPMQPDPQGRAKWNMDNEELWNGPMRVEGCFLNSQGQTLAMAAATQGNFGFALDATGHAINLHGDQCAAKLGAIPAFDCLDDRYFKNLPITSTVDGSTTDLEEKTRECDNPIYLPTGGGGSCKPWARIGRIQTAENTFAAVICRRYWPEESVEANSAGAASGVPAEFLSTNPAEAIPGSNNSWKRNPSGENDPFFNDVAIVQHNSDTGETCFFQALGVLYGKRVPPPTEREVPSEVTTEHPYAKNAASFWLTPDGTANINCINCHDADPWMHSPYVRQVVDENGETVVPSTWDLSWPERYVIIGSDFGFQDWTTTYTVTPESNDSCASCHEIGSLGGCERWARDAGSGYHYQNYKTEFGKSFPKSHWMPPDFSGDQNDWDRRWKDGWQAMVDCCQVADDEGNRILGVAGLFAAEGRYGKTLSESHIAKLEASGCLVNRRSYVE